MSATNDSALPRLRGLWVSVFRDASGTDCTNGGPTSTRKEVFLVGVEDGLELRDDYDPRDVFRIVRRVIAGTPYLHAEPVVEKKGARMFGGNFLYTSDSRFRRSVCDYPIPVHDREENPPQTED